MSSYPPALDHMLTAWNEHDLSRVRGHLESALAPEIHFVDPSIETRGRDEFEANVREFRARLPNARCSRATGIDGHHGVYRYHWEIHRGEELLISGFDVVEINDAQQIVRVLGFFGPIPPATGA